MEDILFSSYKKRSNPTKLVQVGFVEEETLEMVDLIQEFSSPHDFASWITNQNLQMTIYENKIHNEKCIQQWQYEFEKKSFFFGKLEIDQNKIPSELKEQFLQLNPIFASADQTGGILKNTIHSILAEPHYTSISQAIYKEDVVGIVWEIYNLPLLVRIYKQKQDPLRYWRRTRKE